MEASEDNAKKLFEIKAQLSDWMLGQTRASDPNNDEAVGRALREFHTKLSALREMARMPDNSYAPSDLKVAVESTLDSLHNPEGMIDAAAYSALRAHLEEIYNSLKAICASDMTDENISDSGA